MKGELLIIVSVVFSVLGFLISWIRKSKPIVSGERLKASQDIDRVVSRLIRSMEAEVLKLEKTKQVLAKQSAKFSRRAKDAAAKKRVDALISVIDSIRTTPIQLAELGKADAELRSLSAHANSETSV